MTYIYISSILGEMSEAEHRWLLFSSSKDYDYFIREMKNTLGYGVLKSGVLFVENKYKDTSVSGINLYNDLVGFGFDESHAINITRLFSTNNRLIEDLVERGFSVEDVVYGMDLKARLEALGLESSTVTRKYALEDSFVVHQILEVYIEEAVPPPPPEFEVWRPFQISVLIDCTTNDEKGKVVKRSIEFRGIFIAEKYSIIDWTKYTKRLGKSDVYRLLRDAGKVSESVMKEYAAVKGYQDLFECAVPVFDGINLLEDLPDIHVAIDEVDSYETENSLDVVDMNRSSWGNFSDTVKYIGKWWEDENEAIIEMRKQVQSESRW